MELLHSFPLWNEALINFSNHLTGAIADAELGVRLGGQPESVTTNTIVHPIWKPDAC